MEQLGKFGSVTLPFRRNIKEMAKNGGDPVGITISIPSPETVEYAALAGYDYVSVDLECTPVDPELLCNMIRAADSAGIGFVVTVTNKSMITALLDFGVSGIKFPHVKTAEQAADLVGRTHYVPFGGVRGFCGEGRAKRYGKMTMRDYSAESEKELMVTVIIEDAEGVENYREILKTPNIDYVEVGLDNIAQQTGHTGNPEHPDCLKIRDEIYAYADTLGIKNPENGAPHDIAEDAELLLSALLLRVKEEKK